VRNRHRVLPVLHLELVAGLLEVRLRHSALSGCCKESVHGYAQCAGFGLVSLKFSLSRSISLSCSLAFPVCSARAAK
jgi:hypothetical protein